MDGPDLRPDRPTPRSTSAEPPIPIRSRHGGTMMGTTLLWHALLLGAVALWAVFQPIETDGCMFACSHTEQVFWVLVFGGAPLTLSLFVSVLLIVAVIRQARGEARAHGRQLEPADRWADVGMASLLTLVGLLGSAAAIASYLGVRTIG